MKLLTLPALFSRPKKAEPAPAPQPQRASYGEVDARNGIPIPLACQAPVELDHELITKALDQIGQEAHRHARSAGWWAHLDVHNPEHLWLKISLVAEELGEVSRALREGRLTTTKRLATKQETEKDGIYEAEQAGADDEIADIVLRCADACTAANLDLGGAIIRKLYKNRRRPFAHGGRRF